MPNILHSRKNLRIILIIVSRFVLLGLSHLILFQIQLYIFLSIILINIMFVQDLYLFLYIYLFTIFSQRHKNILIIINIFINSLVKCYKRKKKI